MIFLEASDVERYLKKYKGVVYGAAYSTLQSSDDADDVVQESFIALYKSENVFQNDDHVRNWLLKVAVNKARNINRHRGRHPSVPIDTARKPVESTLLNQAKEQESENNTKTVLWSHVNQLPEESKTLIFLRYAVGLDIGQLSALLNLSDQAIYTRLHRARTALKKIIKEGGRDGQ